ncbi:MAG: type II secretion system GspH family protein [Gammaproteobacteria bacterium]|nr:type II secretion system GspH family protein [Gammaproteobacteria bacterium]MDH5274977.1 type II secretion system GspH family protein [Gammaproteobacteria bacterium]
MTRPARSPGRRQAGITYVEALLAVVILGVALVPALETLNTAFRGATVGESVMQAQQKLVTRLENVRAQPFASLDAAALAAGSQTAPSSYSDPGGSANRVLVFLSRYDGDNADGNGNPFDGTDAGLLWVRVAIENTPYELTTLVAQ